MNPSTRLLLLASVSLAACAKHSGNAPLLQLNPSVPRFETRTEITTGTTQHADYAVADLDGDAVLDLAVVGLPGELQVMLGGAGGTFARGQTLQLGGTPLWITGADFDRDGDIDLAVVRAGANAVDILLNDGRADFSRGPSLPVGTDALCVVAGDANDDGLLDIVVTRLVAPEIVVFVGDGGGGFVARPGLPLPGGGIPVQMALGDVTRDGIADLVVADPVQNRVLVYPGQGNSLDFLPTPIAVPVAGGPKAVSIGDLSGDGRADIAVSAFDSNRIVVITQVDPVTPTTFTLQLAAAPTLSTIGDVTGDGLADLVTCAVGNAAVLVFPQLATGGLADPFVLDASGLPLRPFVGDIDRNGRNDLMVLSGLGDRINLWRARTDGRLLGARAYETGLPSAQYVAAADFNGDGNIEAAVVGDSSTRVRFLGRAVDGMTVVHSVDVGFPVQNVTADDLDGDGRQDLVLPVQGGLKVLHNVSTGGAFTFELLPPGSQLLAAGVGSFGVAVADFNRDGAKDIVVAGFQDGTITMLRGSPGTLAFVATPNVIGIGGGPVGLAAADFSGDSVADLAVSRLRQSDVVILRNDGFGNLSPVVTIPVGQAPNYLVSADFNRDGRADLVVSDGGAAAVTVVFSQSVGFATATYPAGASPTALLASDLNGDGNPDILVASLSGGDFRVLTGDGRGGFPNLFPFPGTFGATGAQLQDVTGDGVPDLLISSRLTSRLSVVRNLTGEPQ